MILFFISFLLTLALTFLLVKKPLVTANPSSRGMHETPKPTSGGLAILLSISISSIFLSIDTHFLLLLSFISLIGLLDDIYNISKLTRILSQLILPVLLLYNLPIELSGYTLIIYFLIIIAMTYLVNAFNFMDGIDTIVVNQSIFILLSLYLLSLEIMPINSHIESITLLSLFSILGFGVLNLSPAKIFLGNIGSYLIGFIISYIYYVVISSNINYLFPLAILLSVFIVETLFAIIRRFYLAFTSMMSNGNISLMKILFISLSRITEAHCTHNYQILAKKLKSHPAVNIIILLYNILWCFPLAYMSLMMPDYSVIMIIISFLPYIYWCYYNQNKANE